MTLGDDDFPRCPFGDHEGSWVVRYGSYDSRAGRRQRFLCRPAEGVSHLFSDAHLAWAAQRDRPALDHVAVDVALRPSRFRHPLPVIAAVLVSVGRGASFRQASLEAGQRPNGQLAADWVEVFTPLLGPVPDPGCRGPLALTAVRFVGARGRGGFEVLVAVGGERERVRLLRGVPAGEDRSWRGFLAELDGVPDAVVTDDDQAALAAQLRWPGVPCRPSSARQARVARAALRGTLGARRAVLGNRFRLDLVLDLMTRELNGAASVAGYVDALHDRLAETVGTPGSRVRTIADSWAAPSLQPDLRARAVRQQPLRSGDRRPRTR